MYGLFTYIKGEQWHHSGGDVGNYSLHGAFGIEKCHVSTLNFSFPIEYFNPRIFKGVGHCVSKEIPQNYQQHLHQVSSPANLVIK